MNNFRDEIERLRITLRDQFNQNRQAIEQLTAEIDSRSQQMIQSLAEAEAAYDDGRQKVDVALQRVALCLQTDGRVEQVVPEPIIMHRIHRNGMTATR